jgi:hypothetical protein
MMRNYIPKRYRTLYQKYRTKLRIFFLLLFIYLLLDIILGTLILKYLDPITFAKEYPLLVLMVYGGLIAVVEKLLLKVRSLRLHKLLLQSCLLL